MPPKKARLEQSTFAAFLKEKSDTLWSTIDMEVELKSPTSDSRSSHHRFKEKCLKERNFYCAVSVPLFFTRGLEGCVLFVVKHSRVPKIVTGRSSVQSLHFLHGRLC